MSFFEIKVKPLQVVIDNNDENNNEIQETEKKDHISFQRIKNLRKTISLSGQIAEQKALLYNVWKNIINY